MNPQQQCNVVKYQQECNSKPNCTAFDSRGNMEMQQTPGNFSNNYRCQLVGSPSGQAQMCVLDIQKSNKHFIFIFY